MYKKIFISVGTIYCFILVISIFSGVMGLLETIKPILRKPPDETPVTRAFSTIDLLWVENEIAQKWNIEIVSKADQKKQDNIYYSNEHATVLFSILGRNEDRAKGYQGVFNFSTPYGANSAYIYDFAGKGYEIPAGWSYSSPIADQYSFACTHFQNQTNLTCYWIGQYDEFITEYSIEWVPGLVDLDDIEKMVSEVDQIMAEHLQLPLVE